MKPSARESLSNSCQLMRLVSVDVMKKKILKWRKKMTPEGQVKKEIADYLSMCPAIWFTYTPAYRPMMGRKRSSKNEKKLLDITGFWTIEGRAHIFMVEVKAPGGVREPHQEELVNLVLAAGGFACFAESVEELRSKMRLFHRNVP